MVEAKVLGGFELVGFPELGIAETVAKVDTGAYSGALHATHIREVTTDDGRMLEFYPLGKRTLKTSLANYRLKPVKSSNGQLENRYVIRTKIIVQGAAYSITISLSDRSAMMKSVLLGRQFLRRHHFVVDVRQGTHYRQVKKEDAL